MAYVITTEFDCIVGFVSLKRWTFRGPCHTTEQQFPLTLSLFLIGSAYGGTTNESVCYQHWGKNDPLYYETILENIIMGDLPSKSSHSIRCLN